MQKEMTREVVAHMCGLIEGWIDMDNPDQARAVARELRDLALYDISEEETDMGYYASASAVRRLLEMGEVGEAMEYTKELMEVSALNIVKKNKKKEGE